MHPDIVWQNGSIIPWGQGKTHVMNASLHYGVAAFEGIRFYNTSWGPAIFRLREHLDRLFYSARVAGMTMPYTAEDLTEATKELIRQSAMQEGYIRPIAWFGEEKIGLHLAGGKVDIQIALFQWQKQAKQAFDLHISPIQRIHPATTDVEAKISAHYFNTHLALQHARAHRVDDAILLDHEHYIAEASAANIFLIGGGIFLTPQRGTILNGITRQTIIELARDAHYAITEDKISPEYIHRSHEIFLCGTAYEIIPVVRVDNRIIGTGNEGAFTKRMQQLYRAALHGEINRYHHWLTFINEKGK